MTAKELAELVEPLWREWPACQPEDGGELLMYRPDDGDGDGWLWGDRRRLYSLVDDASAAALIRVAVEDALIGWLPERFCVDHLRTGGYAVVEIGERYGEVEERVLGEGPTALAALIAAARAVAAARKPPHTGAAR